MNDKISLKEGDLYEVLNGLFFRDTNNKLIFLNSKSVLMLVETKIYNAGIFHITNCVFLHGNKILTLNNNDMNLVIDNNLLRKI